MESNRQASFQTQFQKQLKHVDLTVTIFLGQIIVESMLLCVYLSRTEPLQLKDEVNVDENVERNEWKRTLDSIAEGLEILLYGDVCVWQTQEKMMMKVVTQVLEKGSCVGNASWLRSKR